MSVFGSAGQGGEEVLSAEVIINRSSPRRNGRRSLEVELTFSVRSWSCLAQGAEGRPIRNKENRDVNGSQRGGSVSLFSSMKFTFYSHINGWVNFGIFKQGEVD